MAPDMQSLEEYNDSRMKFYAGWGQPKLNGLACPSCGTELMDSNPSMILTTWPAKFAVHCQNCNYTDYRLA